MSSSRLILGTGQGLVQGSWQCPGQGNGQGP